MLILLIIVATKGYKNIHESTDSNNQIQDTESFRGQNVKHVKKQLYHGIHSAGPKVLFVIRCVKKLKTQGYISQSHE